MTRFLTSGTAHISLDASHTLSGLTFSTTGANSYAIGSTDGSQLTLANSGSAVSLVVGGGSQSIGVPMTLDDNLAVNVAAGSSLLITGAVSGNKSLRLSGGGSLALAGSNSYSDQARSTRAPCRSEMAARGPRCAVPA